MKNCADSKFLGKGAFAKCFVAHLGSLKVCIKLLYAGAKYKSLLVKESRILLELSHFNLPWIHAFCDDPSHTAIVMSFHAFCGADVSVNIRDALHALEPPQPEREISSSDWKQVLLGCVSALEYLRIKKVLHNDIKSDNILIERMAPDYSIIRAVVVDFNEACHVEDALLYKLSTSEKITYAEHHPQVAPEVRNGTHKQSYASDVYSMGRIIDKVNIQVIKHSDITTIAHSSLDTDHSLRPTATALKHFFTNFTV